MRNALSIAAGACSETREPRIELISRLKLMSPSPIVTGSISSRIRLIRGSRQRKLIADRDVQARSGPGTPSRTGHAVPASTPIAYA